MNLPPIWPIANIVIFDCDSTLSTIEGIDELARMTGHEYDVAILTKRAMEGDVPNPIDPPAGCPFHPRCLYRFERCSHEKPSLIEAAPGHLVACWLNGGKGIENGSRCKAQGAR